MSVAICIKQVLAADLTDGSASTVSSRNSSLWPTAGVVPEYAYKCLGSLWASTSVSSVLLSRINYQFGEYQTAPEGEISLYTAPIESVRLEEPMFSNAPGAETTFLDIILSQPPGEMSVNRMENVELRIRYLLDYIWRSQRRGGGITPTPAQLTASGDSSISNTILCMWHSYLTPLRATEVGVRYVVAYNRNVPR